MRHIFAILCTQPSQHAIWRQTQGKTEFITSSNANGNGTSTSVLKPGEECVVRRKIEAAHRRRNVSHMHFARKGFVTEEMLFVADRGASPSEKLCCVRKYRVSRTDRCRELLCLRSN